MSLYIPFLFFVLLDFIDSFIATFVFFFLRYLSKDILTIREAVWLTDNTYQYEDLVRMMGEVISVLEGKIRVSRDETCKMQKENHTSWVLIFLLRGKKSLFLIHFCYYTKFY